MWRILLVALTAAAAAFGQHRIRVLPSNELTPVVGSVDFLESNGWLTGTGGNYVRLKGPASLAANVTFELPGADGSSGQCLQTNGAGLLSFGDCTVGGSSFYQTMRDNGVNEVQRAALNFVSASMVLSDDWGGGETEFRLTTSPSNAATLVGTGRNINTTSPLTGGGGLSVDRTIACSTCVTTNTTQTISGSKTFSATLTTRTILPDGDGVYDSGVTGTRWRNVFGDTVNVQTLQFENSAHTSHYTMERGGGTGSVRIYGLTGLEIIGFISNSRTTAFWGDLVNAIATPKPDIGSAAFTFGAGFLEDLHVTGGTIFGTSTYSRSLTFTAGDTYDIATNNVRVREGFFLDVTADGQVWSQSTTLPIRSDFGFQDGGDVGVNQTCTSTQVLLGPVINGGIITGHSGCATN